MDRFSLHGRTALVTGASRGIGAATARALDSAGARVCLVARGPASLSSLAQELDHEPVIVALDLGEAAGPGAAARQALDMLGHVDILVNNAAIAARLATVDTDAALIDTMLAVNVRAPLLLVAALVPSMIDQGGGSIINLSSVSGLVGTPRRAAYAASKGALDAATRSLAIELGPAESGSTRWLPGWSTPTCGRPTSRSPVLLRRSSVRPHSTGGRPRGRGGRDRVPRLGRRLLRDRRNDLRRWGNGEDARPLRRSRLTTRRLRRSAGTQES